MCDAEFTLYVYHLLQLRVGNVIEHNGKLLQVVSLQNRAMGVSCAAGHAAALFAAGPLLAQRRFNGRSCCARGCNACSAGTSSSPLRRAARWPPSLRVVAPPVCMWRADLRADHA